MAGVLLLMVLSVGGILSSQAQLQWTRLDSAGQTGPSNRADSVAGYDPTTNTVFIFGGRGGGNLQDLWSFNLNTNTWQELALTGSKPPGRFSMVGGVYVNGRQFVISSGEGDGKTFFDDVWAYDIQSDTWSLLPGAGHVPEERYGGTGGVHMNGSSLYLTHGFSKTRYSNTFRYDLVTRRWNEEFSGTSPYSPNKPHARCLMGGTMVAPEETVFYGGCQSGGGSGGPCPSVDSWAKERSGSWRRMDDCASARQFSSMAAWPLIPRTAVMFGGDEEDRSVIRNNKAEVGEVDYLDVASGTWKRLATVPDNGTYPVWRKSAAMAATSNGVIVFGGFSEAGPIVNDLWLLTGDPTTAPTVGSCGPNWFLYQHLHGFFMILSWGIILQLGAFIARYFRQFNPLWFKLHQGLQVSGFVLSILGIILVFPGTRAVPNFAHGVIGVLILIGSIQQVINGLCRPHKEADSDSQPKKRVFWEHWHKNIGRLMLLLAAINISLGVYLVYAPVGVIAVWFVIFALFIIAYIVMEIRLQMSRREKNM